MFKVKAITAVIVTGIFGLSACGGGSGDKDDSPVTTVRQKNAALSFTTLPATTAPKTTADQKPLPGSKATTTTAAKTTATTQVKTVTTPLPKLPIRPK